MSLKSDALNRFEAALGAKPVRSAAPPIDWRKVADALDSAAATASRHAIRHAEGLDYAGLPQPGNIERTRDHNFLNRKSFEIVVFSTLAIALRAGLSNEPLAPDLTV